MRRLRTLLLVLLALGFLASFLVAEEEAPTTKVFGNSSHGTTTFESMEGAGLIKLNGTTIQKTLRVAGSLLSKDAEIGSLEITGEANLTNTTVQREGFVIGSLQAVRSTFHKPITLLTQKAVFTASHLEAITIRKDLAYKGKQILELKQGTIVNGPIHFESGKGEVIVFPGSQVIGKVSGGKIIKKS